MLGFVLLFLFLEFFVGLITFPVVYSTFGWKGILIISVVVLIASAVGSLKHKG